MLLTRWNTYRDPDEDQNLTTIDASRLVLLDFSERGGEQSNSIF